MKQASFFSPTDKSIERKRRMAQMLMEQGKQPDKTEIVSGIAIKQSPWEGLGKALSQGLGGYVEAKADKEEKNQQENYRKTMADALGAYGRSQDTTPTQLENGEMINWNQTPIDKSASMYQNILMSNPDTAPLGMEAAMGQMQAKQNIANEMDAYRQKFPLELELARAKAQIDAQYTPQTANIREFQYAQQNPDFAEYQKQSGGGSKIWQDAQNLVAASEAAGQPMDLMTAYGIAKSGLGVGRTYQDGAVAPVEGALDTASDFKYSENRGGAQGTEVGKREGEAMGTLQFLEANMPKLEQVTNELSTLGKTATYTMLGQGADTLTREMGGEVGQGAIDRTAYIAKVDNEILPLLRDTFGAAFTVAEGDKLRATLGNPNISPPEKDAVLNAFISQKKSQVESLKRQVPPRLPTQEPRQVIDDLGIQPMNGSDVLRSIDPMAAPDPERIMAQDALSKGIDPAVVQRMYEQRTGKKW